MSCQNVIDTYFVNLVIQFRLPYASCVWVVATQTKTTQRIAKCFIKVPVQNDL